MIVRRWTARATAQGAADYEDHFRRSVLPELSGIDGHRGAFLLRRADADGAELTVLTLWSSWAAITAFTGDDRERAVVEPRAREVLDDFDETVTHHEVVVGTLPGAIEGSSDGGGDPEPGR